MVRDEPVPEREEREHIVVRVGAAHSNRGMEDVDAGVAEALNFRRGDRLGMGEPLGRLRRTDLERAQHVDDERLAHEPDRSLGVLDARPREQSESTARDRRCAAETDGSGDRRREKIAPADRHGFVMLGLLLRSTSGSGKQTWRPVFGP